MNICLICLLSLFTTIVVVIGFVSLDDLKTTLSGTISERIDGILGVVFGAAMAAFIGLLLYDVYMTSL